MRYSGQLGGALALRQGQAIDQGLTSTTFDSYAATPQAPKGVNLHSQGLMVLLSYADLKTFKDWSGVGPQLYDAYFSQSIGEAAGYAAGNVDGWYEPQAKMLTSIAYTAIQSGAKPFGDTAIVALYDDANELGKIIRGTHNSELEAANIFVKGLNGDVKGGLADILVQYAGDLAKQRSTDQEAKKGAIELFDTDKRLKVEFDSAKWKSTFNTGDASTTKGLEKIIGLTTVVTALAGNILWENGLFNPSMNSFIKAAFDKYKLDGGTDYKNITWLELATTKSDAVTLDASAAVKAKSVTLGEPGPAGGAILIGADGNDTITGAKGNDLIVAGAGDDMIKYSNK
jgi:RTX calcium-binding nonapeptide repeat (4 copies)